jgi:hypothetical protein
MRAIILSGSGRYDDPWHPYPETSALLAELARDAGFEVEVREDVDDALATLDDDVTLLVVNAGDPDGPIPDGGDDGADDLVDPAALDAALERGIGILAMHAAASSLRDYGAFDRALGARWEPDESWHSPLGDASVHVVGNHPVREGIEDFTVQDERYADLHQYEVIEPIAEHVEGGIRHPLVWGRELGRSRLVFDALGHDTRSYDSAEHRVLISQALAWLSRVPAPSIDDIGGGVDAAGDAVDGRAG